MIMNEFQKARALLVDDLRNYLVGPVEGEQEVIPEKASDRYHIGILWPSGTQIAPEEDDLDDGEDVGGVSAQNGDGVFALANASQQSAMGFTFQVPNGVPVIVEASWANYVALERNEAEKPDSAPKLVNTDNVESSASVERVEATTSKTKDSTRNNSANTLSRKSFVWRRQLVSIPPFELKIENNDTGNVEPILIEDHIELVLLERLIEGIRVLTLTIVNRRVRPNVKELAKPDGVPRDLNIYQVQLKVRSVDGSDMFTARPRGQYISDPEYIVHELLYRNIRQFAVGHGCSVAWTTSSSVASYASEIRSEWIPATEVFKASSEVKALTNHPALALHFLIDSDRGKVLERLEDFPRAYRDWIDGLEKSVDDTVSQFEPALKARIADAARTNLKKCLIICDRIIEGISLLGTDSTVYEAFVLANRAMAKSMEITRRGDTPRWRPFQLAFLLLSIPSTAYEENPARHTLDLIWFPTGGGKTEAYLGLVAFTLFFRRLSGSSPEQGYGTGVITRYTLRLLTMQQFERAARAVMACELLRREDEKRFGTEKFSIGLFVGNSATPGTIADAMTVINGTSEDKTLTTLPVAECPWCGTQLVASHHQKADKTTARVHTCCPNNDCSFHSGIPISCVDEELYRYPPSMVIGTVDKFAMMAWRPEIGALFGIGGNSKPPTLIIQDELHLISDALGSMTGLYETAFDLLCSNGGALPKVVGSTATIRRAEKQVHAVFLRSVAQFPPSGLNHDDSFFYCEEREIPGRLYVGVHAQGRSPKHTLARLMGVLSQGACAIPDPKAQDHYWTLVTYFNSLRELGGAWVLGLDDVPKYVKAMPGKKCKSDRLLSQITELTSHLPSTEIPLVLKNISLGKDSGDLDREPVDLLLCTNMISVGVDIDRLGLMIINGQPKTTAEYIQASSRVGRPRGAAGLVVTLYNWTRPRDRSHYERFRTYHESFYRNVEATSVTPFSARARDKALHGVLIALLRLKLHQLADSPADVLDPGLSSEIDALIESISLRAREVTKSEEIGDETREHLEYILEHIVGIARVNGAWARHVSSRTLPCLMKRPNDRGSLNGIYETPMSMRDVDPPCSIELKSLGQFQAGAHS
jgi:hypothetical protein